MAKNPMEVAGEVLAGLGLDKHFILRMMVEDDWSYIIKASALIEAALTHVITMRIGDSRVGEFVTRLGMAQKLRLAMAMSLLSKDSENGISLIKKLRNHLVHEVSHVGFTFASYLKEEANRKTFAGVFHMGATGDIEIGGKTVPRKQFLEENPKWGVMEFLVLLMVEVYVEKAKADLSENHRKVGQFMMDMREAIERKKHDHPIEATESSSP